MPSKLSWALQSIGVSAFATTSAFFVWSKHCHFDWSMSPDTDLLFRSKFYKKFNPSQNPTTHDVCVRRIPLFKLKPELVEDSQKGGSKLVEAFVAGVWGGFGYTPQRLYFKRSNYNPSTADQLWTKPQLLDSKYELDTVITDHFIVLDKTPTSVLVRCGDSPSVSPDGTREVDGLFEMSAEAKLDEGFAEFRLKSILFQGQPKLETRDPPMGTIFAWTHRQYAKLWMESAMRNVRQ